MIPPAYYTLIIVVCCTTLLGFTSGIVGAFSLVRKQSLLGDAIAHACLPGTALAFLATESSNPLLLIIASSCAGWLAVYCILFLERHTVLKMDTILGSILSIFFGLGLVCITYAQRSATAHHANLTTIIFGNASTLFLSDIAVAALLAFVVLILMSLYWKELTLFSFDTIYCTTLGYSTRNLNLLLTGIMIMTIAIGLHMVGSILMSTLIIAPAATARLWRTTYGSFVIWSGIFGAFFATVGTIISSYYARIPTGPVIAIIAVACVLVSLAVAPRTPEKALRNLHV